MSDTKNKALTDDDIIERAEKFYDRVSGVCAEIHKGYNEDIDFWLNGNQWDDAAFKDRSTARRLTLTVNRGRQFIYQVVNDYKKSEMTSKVLPHDTSEHDKKIAEVRRGIMRSIERKHGGLTSYNIAAKTLVAGGLGGWRIVTDYLDPMSFDQMPRFISVEDMATILIDFEDCREPDFSDMRDCLIWEKYTKERFKVEFGKDPDDFLGGGSKVSPIWGSKDGPLVSDYWFKEETPKTLCLLSPIATQLIPEWGKKKTAFQDEINAQAKKAGIGADLLIARDQFDKPITRETSACKVWCAKLAAKKVVEKVEWPIDLIPVAIAQGRRTVNKGKIRIEGLMRQSKDAQKSYNYMKSNKTERIAMSPKVPMMVPEGGIPKGQKGAWSTMASNNPAYLMYATHDEKGRPIPAPHRLDPVQADQGLIEEERAAIDEMKATVGMYDASIGNRSNETSGVAIRNRAAEADTTNYDFTESMVIAIKYSAKVLNALIPKVIDTPRQVSMVGEDDKETVIQVNQLTQDGQKDPRSYHLDEGEFDIDFEAGPSSGTKAGDIRDALTGIFQAVPGTVLPLGSEYIRNSEMRNSDDAADRFERWANTQSPGLYPDKNQGQINPQQVQQMQGQMQQMQQQIQQMQPMLDHLQQENAKLTIQNHAIQADKSNDSAKLEIDRFNADTQRILAEATLQEKQGKMLLSSDELVHKQNMDQHAANLDASQHLHDVQKEHVVTALDLSKHAHAMNKDAVTVMLQANQQSHAQGQAEHKMGLEAKKVSQQGKKPTGANPGNPADRGVKPGNSKE